MSDNSRIAKNTVFMYIRMGITMLVGLYTSRVVLNVLGVDDYGLYNVIGGIISLFTVLNAALVNTTSRFITVSLARDDMYTRQIFNMAVFIHFFVGLLIILLGETAGLWYLHNKLVIPGGREFAAECLYQFTVLSAFLTTLIVPYNAAVIAHEKINVYAVIQIIDVILRLFIVILLKYTSTDKLIFYALLILLVTVFDFIITFIYCRKSFEETKYLFYWSWNAFKDILRFVGWALVGNFSNMFYTQGINLMLNAFCGPAANAARGIAVQVENMVRQFANNVQTAINPQIIKSYSKDNMDRMHDLICASSRYCYYLLLLFALPIMLETDYILHLWLGLVPEHTINFVRLTLLSVLLDAFVNPMFTANLASGKLNLYYIPVSIVSFSFMFITYFAIKQTRIPESVFICYLSMIVIGVIIRVFVMNKQVQLSAKRYFNSAILPALIVTVLSAIVPIILHVMIEGDVLRLLITTSASVMSTGFVVYFIGISEEERQFTNEFIANKAYKYLKKQ